MSLLRPASVQGVTVDRARDMKAPSSRRSLAILSTWHPEPVDNGRKQRTRMIISQLSGDYEITLISMLSEDQIGECQPAVPGVRHQYVVPLPETDRAGWRYLLGFASELSRSLVETWSAQTASLIYDYVDKHNCSAAIGTDLRTLRYLQKLPRSVIRILDEPDVSPFVGIQAQSARAALREQKYRRLLTESTAYIDRFISASEIEARALNSASPGAYVVTIPNGVPVLPKEPWHRPPGYKLLYTGSMTYAPNADAVRWFSSEILPQIRREFPEVVLNVTGSRSKEQAPHGVELLGLVPDLPEVMQAASLVILPIREGTGTRIKLLEALAMGMPVVSTRKGAEGLPVVHGEHLLLADSASEFADNVIELLRDPERAMALGNAGRRLIREQFTWDRIGEQLREVIDSAIPAADQVTT